MAAKDRLARVVRRADREVQAVARFAPAARRILGLGVAAAVLLIIAIIVPMATGLGLAALVLREPWYAYGSLAAGSLMVVLLALVLRFKVKTEAALRTIVDLTSVTEFILDELFESLQEAVVVIGVVIMILGAAFAGIGYISQRDWLLPIGFTTLAAGASEMVVGGLAGHLLKRVVGGRMKAKAVEGIEWAHDLGEVPKDG